MALTVEKISKWEKKNKASNLTKALDSKEPSIRVAVIRALGNIEEPESINTLVNLLQVPEKEIKIATLNALANRGVERSVEFVRALLSKENDPEILEQVKSTIATIKEKCVDQEAL